jgi:hypothetical protein
MMRIARSLIVLIGSGSVASACALPKAQTGVYPNGIYAFDEHSMSATPEFRGRLEIVGDSVHLVDTEPACVETTVPPTKGPGQLFLCGDYTLMVGKRSERWGFSYSAQQTAVDYVDKCTAYNTVDGRQVCTKTSRERRERVLPISGTLRLTRVDNVTR